MTEAETRKFVAMLIAAWPHTKAVPETVMVYEMGLSHLDQATAMRTFRRLLASRNYLPSVAEILSAVDELSTGPVRAGGEGWGEVIRAIGRYGFYRQPGKDFQFDDPIVARCVDALGWGNLCSSDNQQADRARFIELYDKLARGERTERIAAQIGGDSRPALPERTGNVTAIADVMRRLGDGK